MYSLLLLSSLLHITTCTVYTVTPDDHYYPNTTCHHCHNLQHYLLNITKYFTSNTQLLFLPGLHHLHTDLIIQNVHNISLIGGTANGTTLGTVIKCSDHHTTCVTIANVSMVTITTLIIEAKPQQAYMIIKDCYFMLLNNLQFKSEELYIYGTEHFILKLINIMGSSYFNQIILPVHGTIELFYNETQTDKQHHVLTLNSCKLKALRITMIQQSYIVILKIVDIQFDYNYYDEIISSENLGINKIFLINCQFIYKLQHITLFSFASSSNGSVTFINCQFEKDRAISLGSQLGHRNEIQRLLFIMVHSHINLEINNCNFYVQRIGPATILYSHNIYSGRPTHVFIKNTNFTYYYRDSVFYTISEIPFIRSFILLLYTNLQIEGSVVFSNITTPYSIISLKQNSSIIITGSVEFSNNDANELINFQENNMKYVIMKPNSAINIIHNKAQTLFATKSTIERYPYPFCLFQYFTSDSRVTEDKNFLIRFYNNQCEQEHESNCFDYIPITNCQWLPQSVFSCSIPLEINERYIQFINNSGTYKLSQVIEQSSLCVCTDKLHYDCHINDLGYLYPGQTVSVLLHRKRVSISNSNTTTAVGVKTDINQNYITPCIVLNVSENTQFADDKGCNKLQYTIGFFSKSYCELFIKMVSDSDAYLNVFYIWQLPCPIGFVKIDKRCQCDPVLVQYGITNCNIND